MHAHCTHEYQTIHNLWMVHSGSQGDRCSHRVANEMCSLDAHGLHEIEQMIRPQLQTVVLIGSRVSIAEANLIVGEDMETLCQIGDGELPVGPGRDPWPRTVNEDHRCSTTHFVIVRLYVANLNGF